MTWNHPINTLVQLVINKQQILGGCDLKLEIYKKGDKEELGSLTINLSEYAGSGVTTERYLLQNCKFNSTIKVYKMQLLHKERDLIIKLCNI